ncbi:hypothetical protein ANCDUO_15124 [Ancylostoma duodenale]|uniref:Uncharacterized protein n=1 Tax=Ancylostoma duodenale TaxID=51022 RepID=A0A0C2CEG8_9BILA|nr:hypothetical protein ANCDUO_15124 [Ancylostoma duodenale]
MKTARGILRSPPIREPELPTLKDEFVKNNFGIKLVRTGRSVDERSTSAQPEVVTTELTTKPSQKTMPTSPTPATESVETTEPIRTTTTTVTKGQTSTTSSREPVVTTVSTRSTAESTTTSTRKPDIQSTTTTRVTTETLSSKTSPYTTHEPSTPSDKPRPPTTGELGTWNETFEINQKLNL